MYGRKQGHNIKYINIIYANYFKSLFVNIMYAQNIILYVYVDAHIQMRFLMWMQNKS